MSDGISDAKLAELRAKWPEGEYAFKGRWAAFIRTPTLVEAKQYEHELHDPALKADAGRNLFRKIAALCWTRSAGECDVEKLYEGYPLAHVGCRNEVEMITGIEADNRSKG